MKFDNEPMDERLEWRLEKAYREGNKEEIKRLNQIWLEQKGAA